MVKSILIATLVLAATFSANGQSLKFKVDGLKDTTVYLVKYVGKNMYYADTAEMKNSMVTFDGSKQKPGILGLLLPEQKFFEFIYNNEDVSLETDLKDLMGNLSVKKSKENEVFRAYVSFLGKQKKQVGELTEKRKAEEKDSEGYNKLTDEINAVSSSVKSYQENLIEEHKNLLVSKIVKMSMDIEVPEPPKDDNGNLLDSMWSYKYYRSHFFDNIDLNDDRLVNTPLFHNKLQTYFGKTMMVQHWDTIIKYAFDFCDRLDPKSEMFKYCVIYITSTFEKSKIMGMDKVFVMMGERYYCAKDENGEPFAYWMKEDKLKELCEKVEVNKNLVMGVKPPNIILRDTTDQNWADFYSNEAEFTVLYFWDPNCGHCKKVTPKLETLYKNKFKDRNVEVFAVGKAVGDEFEKWKAYIRDNHLTFTNVAVTESLFTAAVEDARKFVPKYTTLESLNYQTTYDIYSTPRMFVLDKDKKIIAKQLTMHQLEDMIDRLQGKEDAEKLIEPDPEEQENMSH